MVAAEPARVTQVASARRGENAVRVAAVDLAGCLQEQPPVGNQPRHREPGVCNPLFAADEVLGDERAIGPRHLVGMERVDLAEPRPQLPDLQQQAARQRRERDEALLEIDALLGKSHEEVGAGIRIDDRLEGRFGLAHRQRLLGPHVVLPPTPTKLPITAMSGLKIFEAALTFP